jgi:lipoate-protein ligase B
MTIQTQAYQLVQQTGFPVVLGFEYYPVVTLGKRAELNEELLGTRDELVARGFEIAETDRGGQATLHSPGQLVIYPIVPIQKLKISVRDYVAALEDATI